MKLLRCEGWHLFGAITSDAGPLTVTVTLWRDNGEAWVPVVSTDPVSLISDDPLDLLLDGGAIGDLVVVTVTDSGDPSLTTTVRAGHLPSWEPEVRFTQSTFEVWESDGSAEVFVGLSEASPVSVSVEFRTVDDTALAGVDYDSSSGILTFSAGAEGTVTQSIFITIHDDPDVTGDRSLKVVLENPSSGLSLGMPSEVTLTIMDSSKARRAER